ncbi:MAG: hypothetical protein ACW97Z_03975 [Candidatus Hodarchaeales archaeon]|jgi:hypothetical protein
MTFRVSEDEKKDNDTLEKVLASLNTTAQVKPEIKEYLDTLSNRIVDLTRDYYAAILYLFTSPLSLHQRLILMQLVTIYPKGSSGIELARSLGISEKSKSIYRDLKFLRSQHLISTEDIHPRLRLVYANSENRLMNRLIELVQIHGSELKKILQEI